MVYFPCSISEMQTSSPSELCSHYVFVVSNLCDYSAFTRAEIETAQREKDNAVVMLQSSECFVFPYFSP